MKTSDSNKDREAQLIGEIARVVFGWRTAPGRFIISGRRWLPHWRFSPFERVDDAFQVLDRVSERYTLSSSNGAPRFSARVKVGRRVGKASGDKKARTITLAVIKALGLELAGGEKHSVSTSAQDLKWVMTKGGPDALNRSPKRTVRRPY
jgi:hypothetical protein